VSRRLEKGVALLRRQLRRAGITMPAALLAVLLAGHAAEAAPPTLMASLGRMAMAGPGAPAAGAPAAPVEPPTWRPARSRTMIKLIAAVLMLSAATALLSRYAYLEIARRRQLAAMVRPSPVTARPYHRIDRIEQIIPPRFEGISFARALEMATSLTPYPASYRDIVGDSALAFRTRWYAHPRPEMGTAGWLGDGPEEIALLRRATGWQLNVRAVREGKLGEAAQFAPDVVTSIQAGIPVINKLMSWESGLVYGASTDAQVLLVREFGGGGRPTLTRELIPLFIFLGNHAPPDDRKACVLRALSAASANWTRGRVDSDPLCLVKMPPQLEYVYGQAAFDQWMSDLTDVSKRTQRSRAMVFQLGIGQSNSYLCARRTAREYLLAHAPLFSAEAQVALHKAADLYGQECDLLDETRKPYGPDAFLGPWQQLGFRDWDPEVRQNEIDIIRKLRDLDAQAIAQIQSALHLEASTTGPNSAASATSTPAQ
jgi:hypothetical protein